jgi:hypothetical protein
MQCTWMQMWFFQLEEDKYLGILLNVSQSYETETGIHFGMFIKQNNIKNTV